MTQEERILRNAAICDLYLKGFTQDAIARQYNLSKMSVCQILKQGGLTKYDRPRKIIGPQNSVGIVLSEVTKEKLRKVAADRNTSMSRIGAEAIEKEVAE